MHQITVVYRPAGEIIIAEFEAEDFDEGHKLAEEYAPEGYSIYSIREKHGDMSGGITEVLGPDDEEEEQRTIDGGRF